MSTLFLDISRLVLRLHSGLRPTGIDRVGLAYIERYRERARAIVSLRGFSGSLSPSESQHAFDLLLASTRKRDALRRIAMRACINGMRGQYDKRSILLHTSHNGMEYPRYYGAMAKRQIRSVFMVHDLIPMTHAEYCRPGIDAAHRKRIHTALRLADGLIMNSTATLDTLTDEAHRADLRVPPGVVAHLAPGNTPHAPGARPIDAPYFVMLGTIEPRKNHWFMLHVWRRLVERLGAAAPKLVVIGHRGWESENTFDMLDRCMHLQDTVIEESDCSDERLAAWLHHARALLFPSFVEGYGMPIIEALAMHVPVIASDIPVFREIAGDTPDFLDPLDGPGWLARIEAYAKHESIERDAQRARIAAFRTPTWHEHFAHVDRFLETLA
ncbi:glycosyltransferase family 4 protein [Pararobbsia silviterrae]|uniref:Glycosyltransferase family 1 protein n=1 Tax=Pararobbsia silviterrae TaxID=1792498 RepID=A0A494XHT5_9BURK|nr:glycosyltransferase family 1 protein [Pararobbsia silviterrae]RKP47729.1 glycosyltransferase family 1 protein [Pararobbsia silviterrae]